jgi:PiT family inorganic phosphate transporter
VELESILKLLILLIGFYMAWNIGANDVSNAMGTSVGSGALTLRRAVCLAALLEFSGAFFLGANVTQTVESGLIQLDLFSHEPTSLILGMCGALLGASIWLQVASYFGLPVSTTHAIIGAILGFGALLGGFGAIRWDEISSIALSWILSPILSGLLSYLLFSALQHQILFAMNPMQATRRFMPILTSITFGTFSLSLLLGGLRSLHLSLSFSTALLLAILIGASTGAICYLIIRRLPQKLLPSYEGAEGHLPHTLISLEKAIKHLRRVRAVSPEETREQIARMLQQMQALSSEMRKKTSFSERTSEYRTVEKWFVYLQIISACFVAFAHGANDVANAIGPVALVLSILQNGSAQHTAAIPTWLLAFGGIGIVIGLATWGWRVIETIGKKITELTPTRGFCAEFGAALTILIASKLGMPISTTHCLVGSVLGIGLARGIRALNLRTIKEIVLSWIITLPASALMSIVCYYILKIIIL